MISFRIINPEHFVCNFYLIYRLSFCFFFSTPVTLHCRTTSLRLASFYLDDYHFFSFSCDFVGLVHLYHIYYIRFFLSSPSRFVKGFHFPLFLSGVLSPWHLFSCLTHPCPKYFLIAVLRTCDCILRVSTKLNSPIINALWMDLLLPWACNTNV